MGAFFEKLAEKLNVPVWFVYAFAGLLVVALLYWLRIARVQ